MLRPYELTFIVRPNTNTEVMDEQIQQVQDWLQLDGQGRILKEDIWGRRKLAYEIDHQSEAHYVHYLIEMETEAIADLERNLILAPDVLRHLIIGLDEMPEIPDDPPTSEETAAEEAVNEKTTPMADEATTATTDASE